MSSIGAQTQVVAGGKPLAGEVVYLYAFDLAYDMKRQPLESLLGQPVRQYSIGPSKRIPRHLFFYRPQMVDLPSTRRQGPAGPVEVRTTVKVFGVGAVSIQVRVPFEVARLEDLVGYHDVRLDGRSLHDEVYELAESVRRELAPYCVQPVPSLRGEEAYTVFCLAETPAGGPARTEEWLQTNRRLVAGLLTQEEDITDLSEQEAAEATQQYLSYYEHDLVVVDWDAALVIDGPDGRDEVLHIMELANVQLVELTAYDRMLDNSLQIAYRDLAGRTPRILGGVHRGLREIRVDLARLSDELLNITKFFGDWHLARIYQQLFARFHLADWNRGLNDKLRTLGELYGVLQQDRINLWMVVLEATIVILFVVDVVITLLKL